MSNLKLKALQGGTVELSKQAVDGLAQALRGRIVLPAAEGYEEARTIWNAMIERKPGLILRAAGVSDVMQAVRFAREHDLLLSIRGGGHNIAGHALCEGGLTLDLSAMRSVRVSPTVMRAWVEPGATLGDLDRETQAFGLAVPTGINSTTGVAGLTLGGGFGWITRKYGLTIDNLVSADVVLADGSLVRASGGEHPDLFWALRGGGGNFGVVTGFELNLHSVGPQVLSGLVIHPLDSAAQLLKQYRNLLADAPDELTCWVVMRQAPPLPFLPAEWHGREILVFAICYCGDPGEGEKATARYRALGKPIVDVVSPHSFVAWQSALDPLLTHGARNYWKSHDFLELSDGVIEAMIAAVRALPSAESEVVIAHLGGAMTRVAPEATAFPQRKAHFVMNLHTRWREAARDRECIQWARKLFDATAPHAAGSVYVNFIPEDESSRVRLAYGQSYERLAAIKARYDPRNAFRINQNIAPNP
jgi:FAD/FMN-containing dehydrogenase